MMMEKNDRERENQNHISVESAEKCVSYLVEKVSVNSAKPIVSNFEFFLWNLFQL